MDSSSQIRVSNEGKGKEYVNVEIMHNLYDLMFEVAVENYKEALKYKNTCNPEDMKKELKHSMLAVLMSYLCLESYINWIGYDKLGRSPDKKKQEMWERLRGDEKKGYRNSASTSRKWLDISKEVTKTNETFDIGGEPWKSFKHLTGLRQFIVHYKPEPKPQDPPSKWRCGKYPLTEAQKKINPDEAKKAVETAEKMIRKLNEFMQTEPPKFLETKVGGRSVFVTLTESLSLRSSVNASLRSLLL